VYYDIHPRSVSGLTKGEVEEQNIKEEKLNGERILNKVFISVKNIFPIQFLSLYLCMKKDSIFL